MVYGFVCPGCHRRLHVPEGCTAARLTCPLCLADFPSPATGENAAGISAAPPGPGTAVPTCPACGTEVRPEWRLCPRCGQPLRRQGRPEEGLDREVRQDSLGGGCAAVAVAVLVLLGVVLFFSQGDIGLVLAGRGGSPAVLVVVVIVVGGILGGLVALASGRKAVSGVVSGMAAGVGVVLVTVVVVCLAVVAVVAAFFEACGKLGK
jgi:hypothetical protein